MCTHLVLSAVPVQLDPDLIISHRTQSSIFVRLPPWDSKPKNSFPSRSGSAEDPPPGAGRDHQLESSKG